MLEDSNALEKLAEFYIRDQKKKRFWSIFFKCIFALLVIIVLISSQLRAVEPLLLDKPHVGIIDVKGIIQEKGTGSADNLAESLHHAYASKGLKGIILRINSPGGSPVQADYMFNEIRRYRKEKPEVPVYAVCSDICASAAYYIAAAADNIYSNQASLVGSIGVIYNGFGVTDLMAKVGVKSRIQTSGENKAMMNPFLPETARDKAHLQKMLDTIHKRFIDRVKEGRGSRLLNDPTLFSGLFWPGIQAKKLGLVDDFASAGMLVRGPFSNARAIDYTVKPNIVDKLAKQFGAQLGLSLKSVFSSNILN